MKQIVALLGRRDEPTDALADYCSWLGKSLSKWDYELLQVRMPWRDKGWLRALRWLWGESAKWKGQWVLIQYTAMQWSKRGFPLWLLVVLGLLRLRAVHLAIIFHDPSGYPGQRWIDRIRCACQQTIMRTAYLWSKRSIHNVPVDGLTWLPPNPTRAVCIPVGAAIPEGVVSCANGEASRERRAKTVAVFGITGGEHGFREAADLAYALQRAAQHVARLRLTVFGRGSEEAGEMLEKALTGSNVDLSVLGLLPPEAITRVLTEADVQLFVRGPLSSQRSSGIAGIACGLPVVGYTGAQTGFPLSEAGVMLVPQGDKEALAEALVKVLTDGGVWQTLHQRSVQAQRQYFSWDAIAKRFTDVLQQ